MIRSLIMFFAGCFTTLLFDHTDMTLSECLIIAVLIYGGGHIVSTADSIKDHDSEFFEDE